MQNSLESRWVRPVENPFDTRKVKFWRGVSGRTRFYLFPNALSDRFFSEERNPRKSVFSALHCSASPIGCFLTDFVCACVYRTKRSALSKFVYIGSRGVETSSLRPSCAAGNGGSNPFMFIRASNRRSRAVFLRRKVSWCAEKRRLGVRYRGHRRGGGFRNPKKKRFGDQKLGKRRRMSEAFFENRILRLFFFKINFAAIGKH